MTAAFVFGLIAFAAVIANLAIRDHRRSVALRRALFDDCRGVFDEDRWSAGGDGFPRLDGHVRGVTVRAELIPDTMVVRRLPQLWLSMTLLQPRAGTPSLSLLTRQSGNEFYAATHNLERRIEPPPGLPLDVFIRGEGAGAEAMCRRMAPLFADMLGDACVKEITITAKGVRVLRQVAEGRRGEHLLLRQAVFEDTRIERAVFAETLRQVLELSEERGAIVKESAA